MAQPCLAEQRRTTHYHVSCLVATDSPRDYNSRYRRIRLVQGEGETRGEGSMWRLLQTESGVCPRARM